ncbi:MAG: hypothetical protein WC455_09240 [Dehalococcoidia bacterium]|jgi:hypothetical protein
MLKPEIGSLKLKKLVASPDFTQAEKLAELERRESVRIPEDHATESGIAKAIAEVNRGS